MKRSVGASVIPATTIEGDSMEIIRVNEPRTILSNLPFKNPSTLVSKKGLSDIPLRDYLRCRCASGISTSENDLYDKFPSRYRRKDCLRLLKSFHQIYSANTTLTLHHGIWILAPVVEGE